MSDLNSTDGIEFEQEGADEMEFIALGPGESEPKPEPEKKPEGVTLTAEEYEKLLKGGDSTSALTAGLGQLAESLRNQPQPMNVPQAAPFNPDEIEELAFKPKGFTEAVSKVVGQMMGQMQSPLAQGLVEQNKRILKLDPATSELFTEFESDIEKIVQGLPPSLRFQPDIYERVYKDVVFRNQGKIIERMAQKKADEMVKKAGEKKAEEGKKEGNKVAMYQEGAPRGVAGAPPKAKKTVYLTQDDVRDMVERGMDPSDSDQKKSYWENVASKRRK